MAILCVEEPDIAAEWQRALRAELRDVDVYVDIETNRAQDVRMVVLWDELEVFATHPNVQAAVILGAGVDHLLSMANQIPECIQIIRLVDASITGQMLEWVALAVLTQTRCWGEYRAFQRDKNYEEIPLPVPAEPRVGILGAGVLGVAAGKLLSSIGYQVGVWSRSAKSLDGIDSYSGEDGLERLYGVSDICICMLPLTDATRGICDASLFEAMKTRRLLHQCGEGRTRRRSRTAEGRRLRAPGRRDPGCAGRGAAAERSSFLVPSKS